MRFVSRIDAYLPGDILERAPTVWDRIKAVWGAVDLRTDRMRDKLEAATFVYEFRRVLDAMNIDNARSLVVDGMTVFHDANQIKGDLPDLVLALSEHVAVFGESSRELRLSVEHEEAGLRLIVEATVTPEHGRDAPSARITVLGQLGELEPSRGESAEDYRARIEPFVSDPKRTAAVRLQFSAFIARLEATLIRLFADSRFHVTTEALDVALLALEPRLGGGVAAGDEDDEDGEEPDSDDEPRSARAAAETAVPQRNFSISVEQRIAALMSGPPQYAVRLRRIEDLEDEIVQKLRDAGGDTIPVSVARAVEQLNRLIVDHNRYYPVEANLPMDAASGQLLEMGEPWRPRPPATIDDLRGRAQRKRAAK